MAAKSSARTVGSRSQWARQATNNGERGGGKGGRGGVASSEAGTDLGSESSGWQRSARWRSGSRGTGRAGRKSTVDHLSMQKVIGATTAVSLKQIPGTRVFTLTRSAERLRGTYVRINKANDIRVSPQR